MCGEQAQFEELLSMTLNPEKLVHQVTSPTRWKLFMPPPCIGCVISGFKYVWSLSLTCTVLEICIRLLESLLWSVAELPEGIQTQRCSNHFYYLYTRLHNVLHFIYEWRWIGFIIYLRQPKSQGSSNHLTKMEMIIVSINTSQSICGPMFSCQWEVT